MHPPKGSYEDGQSHETTECDRISSFTTVEQAPATAYCLLDRQQEMRTEDRETGADPIGHLLLGGSGAHRWRRRLKHTNCNELP